MRNLITAMRLRRAGFLVRARRRFLTALALLGFVLVAAGAAHVNHSREARDAASAEAEATAQQWLRSVAVELAPGHAEQWHQESSVQPLVILEAICPTEVAR